MYRVIGRRCTVRDQARGSFEAVLGTAVDDALVGALVSTLPDGVVLERRGQWFETERGQLKAVNMLDPGKLFNERGRPVKQFTREEYWAWMEETKRLARTFLNGGE